MYLRKCSTRIVLARMLVFALAFLVLKPISAETIKVSGHGEVTVPTVKRQKDQAAINQKSLADAEELAKQKAIRQAILQVFANQDAIQSKLNAILQTAIDNSATLILDQQVVSAGIQGTTAQVDLIEQVDAKALRTLLESNFSLSSTIATEGKFRIYVLSYTLEGMDPNRSGPPQVTHEEVVDDQKGVHQSSFANSDVESAKHSTSASYAATKSDSDKGNASAAASGTEYGTYSSKQSGSSTGAALNSNSVSGAASGSSGMNSASMSGSGSSFGAGFSHQSTSSDMNAQHSASASASQSANWDRASASAVDARKAVAGSQYSSVQNSGTSSEDTSHYYHRVVDYADPTKKGAALSNEVRAEVEGMMTTVGFDVATLNVSMMNRDFPTEDDLVSAVLNEMRANPSVAPNDYVAIALNSFTPVSAETHRFTSKVTYRVVRVKDGLALLPAKDITGDSGSRAPSDDVARTYAVNSAMLKVDDILPGEIKQALQKMQRADQREAANAAVYYVIVVDNATSLSTSAPIRTALTAAGFKVDRSINGLAKTHTLTVTLDGKTGQDVMNAIEGAMDVYDVQTMDSQGTRVKAK